METTEKMQTFKTHTGELVSGQRLADALNAVADRQLKSVRAIRKEDAYASHVTEETKAALLQSGLDFAERIRNGSATMTFWLWQRINIELTGECIALLPYSPNPAKES